MTTLPQVARAMRAMLTTTQRQTSPAESKCEAVRLVTAPRSGVAATARALSIPVKRLRRWQQE
jgi:hypothetical protein